MASNLQSIIEELTAYPPTDHPFLSVYLDMQPDGNGRRQFLTTLPQDFDLIASQIKARGGDLESFNADRERIMNYLDTEAPVDAEGLAIFACHAENIWHTIPLQVRVETRVVEDRFPHVFELARIDDDYETFALVLADAQESRIFTLTLNRLRKVGETESSEPIRRFEAGGWGQMLFQRYTKNVIKAHTKEINDKLSRIIKRYDVQHVIIGGNDSVKGTILSSLSQDVRDKLVDYVNVDVYDNLQSILETIQPLMEQVERDQEADDVATLETQVHTRGGRGVVGREATALALSKGQVRLLFMLEDFSGVGSMGDDGFLLNGVHSKNPYDGSEMHQVELREAFTAKAAQQGATIQVVQDSDFLRQHEGVGALLWYNDEQVRDSQIGEDVQSQHTAG